MKLKNILLSGLSLVLVAALAIGGTVAYLQDDDSDVNVMTLGNVSIEQIEQEWNAGETALQDFTQAKPLYPYVGNLGWENTTDNGGAYRRFTMNNVVDKYVSVKNTGKSDAYVRTIIALEMGDFSYADLGNIIGVSINKYNGDEFQFAGAWDWTDDFAAEIDGKNYNIMVAVHKDAIEPGETTIPSLLQVYMNKDATNEDCEKIDGNGNGTYDVLVFSQAVQAAGFADAETALDAAFGDINTTSHPWVDGNVAIPAAPFVNTAADLKAALEAGQSVTLGTNIDLGDTQINIAAGSDVTLNLGGMDLTGAYTGTDHYAMFNIANGAYLTVNGDGKVFAVTQATESNRYLAIFENAGNLTINGGSYTLEDSTSGQSMIIATIVDNRTSGSTCNTLLTINDGEFAVTGNAMNLFRNYPQQGGTATIKFEGGRYYANENKETTYIWNQEAGSYPGELYFNGGIYDSDIVYEDYNGQSDIHIASGVNISAYIGNN